jgi:hypothetical protein
MDVTGNELPGVFQQQELSMRTKSIGGTGPDGVQRGVEELSALRSCQTGLGWFPALRCQTRGGECFESALRLAGEDTRAAANFAGREWNAAEILK